MVDTIFPLKEKEKRVRKAAERWETSPDPDA